MKRLSSIFFVTLLTHRLFCAQFNGVGFQVVQCSKGLDDVANISYIAEDEILNGFFDSGFISSNSPTVVFNGDDDALWKEGFGDASESRFSAFLQLKLYFKDSDTNSKLVKLGLLEKVSWSLSRVPKGDIVSRGEEEVKAPSSKDGEETLRTFLKNVFSDISKKLKLI